jgi:N-acetylglutamate synthase-like GNAT family acetyltransferase
MIVYRQATQADAPAVLALLEEIMEHHGFVAPERDRLSSTVSSIIAASDHCFLLAEADGPAGAPGGQADSSGGAAPRIVGMCALIFTISTWSAAPICELQDVIVTEVARRGSVGQGLVNEAERIARERGCARLQLLAEYWNLGAHAFYRNLGLNEKTCLYFERDLTS